jgi:hypothetical protein
MMTALLMMEYTTLNLKIMQWRNLLATKNLTPKKKEQ